MATERQAVEHRPSAGDDIGAKRERAEDILAATDAGVVDDRHAAADGVSDARELRDGGRHTVERASAVVRHVNAIDAALDRINLSPGRHHALDHHG